MATNKLSSIRVEFHVLQSFPVTCLNRDDVGSPKTAIVGGSTRARVSSQCWKRAVRLALREYAGTLGTRTKLIAELIANECIKQGATNEQALACGKKVEEVFIKSKPIKEKEDDSTDSEDTKASSEDSKTDTLLFLSPNEVSLLAEEFKKNDFIPDKVITHKDAKKQAKEIENIIGKTNNHVDAIDIALFGRMVAQANKMDIEGAASFSHAISTHKATNEIEFFTALDDLSSEQGSAHMGSLEFNSATYYRYICLDVGQLNQTLLGNISEGISSFIKALYVAIPGARQTTQSGASPWEFARVYIRKGQRLQVPFETAVKAKNGGYLESSKDELKAYLDKKEKLSGSLFGKIQSYEFGDDESFSIDMLISNIVKEIESLKV